MELCFATNNQGKLEEIRKILGDHFTILSLQDIGCNEELPEDFDTLEENSRQKAQYVHEKYKVSCFADDTGLEVECLNGAPGVYSARFAGPACNPDENMNLLLEKMENCNNRQARFRTYITLILNGQANQFEGIAEGEILSEKKGLKGFGYDPIFIPKGYDKTFAELSIEEKNAISHRGKAVRKLTDYLQSLK